LIEDDAAVAVLEQSPHHVRAHPAQPNHPELHGYLLIVCRPRRGLGVVLISISSLQTVSAAVSTGLAAGQGERRLQFSLGGGSVVMSGGGIEAAVGRVCPASPRSLRRRTTLTS
jgi:hypothetical protein